MPRSIRIGVQAAGVSAPARCARQAAAPYHARMSRPSVPAAPFPLDKADLCVKCGLCLPHCPTYGETRHEGDSPRGRIALMQGLASGLVTASPVLQAHLDGCLSCRRCETVCPAKVPYGELLDAARGLQARSNPASGRLARRLAPWLSQASLRGLLRVLLKLAQRSGLARLARGALRRWASLLPAPDATIRVGSYQAPAQDLPVALFRGCVNDIAERQTLAALETLLRRAGFALQPAAAQSCCGALAQHAGQTALLTPLITRNVQAFAEAQHIVYAGSGCGATLREYGRLEASAGAFAQRVTDPHRLLLQHWPQGVALKPLPLRAALHLPCTQQNVCGGSDDILALLRKIPELELLPLSTQQACCGAAGTYFLNQPQMADQLLAHKLDELAALQPALLLSSNIGCSLHLAAGLRRRGLKVPVRHPLALLAQQWPDA